MFYNQWISETISWSLTLTFTPPVDLVVAHTDLTFSAGITHHGVDI